jgi:hypothetical protein
MKLRVGVKQDRIAHGEAKSADAAGRREARAKKCVGSDRVLVKIADRPRRTTISVTGVVEDNRRYTVVIEEPLYVDPL